MKKLSLILLLGLSGCSSSYLNVKREATLDCTKELIEYDTPPIEAYRICKDLHEAPGVKTSDNEAARPHKVFRDAISGTGAKGRGL